MIRYLVHFQYPYRRQYEPRRVAAVNAVRATVYAALRGLIDWLEPPTATSYEWRQQRQQERRRR